MTRTRALRLAACGAALAVALGTAACDSGEAPPADGGSARRADAGPAFGYTATAPGGASQAVAVATARLQAANVTFTSVDATSDGVVVRGASTRDAVTKALDVTGSTPPTVRPVLAVGSRAEARRAESGAVAPGEPVAASADPRTISCDASPVTAQASATIASCDGTDAFVLGPVAVAPEDVVRVTQTQGHAGASDVVIELTATGKDALATLTRTAAGQPDPTNRVALLAGSRVVSAPTVMGAITNGQVQVSAGGRSPLPADKARDLIASVPVDFAEVSSAPAS